MFLFHVNAGFLMAVGGWGGGAPSWLGPSVGQTMVEESSIVERVPEPLQKERGGRRAATKMDGL